MVGEVHPKFGGGGDLWWWHPQTSKFRKVLSFEINSYYFVKSLPGDMEDTLTQSSITADAYTGPTVLRHLTEHAWLVAPLCGGEVVQSNAT